MASTVGNSSRRQARGDPSPLEQKLGQATSVIMPLLEFGAIGFWTWVFCYLICVQYLIRPSDDLQRSYNLRPRQSTGIALIVVYAILLLLLLVPWMRLIQVIWSKPDILPHGSSLVEKKDADASHIEQYDVYVCDYDGAPLYCEKCNIYKPDRTHHCKELGRCVRKMDHYCPWAGGIIAETSHKFFMQALFGGALYTFYLWLVVAIFLADRISKTGDKPSTWIGALASSVLMCIFVSTMACMTGYNLAINYTSVEGIKRGGVSNIAFLISRTPHEPTLPPSPPNSSKSDPKDTGADDDWPVLRIVQRSGGRRFVVMQSKPYQHPWATTLMQGWKDTMGESVIEWLLPIKMSPCKKKSRSGEFRWGEVVYDMARKYQKENPGTRLALLEGTR